ncbi:MAG: site-specific integrase [Actinomycetota bacterium]|nr:site-specific integrase [Actinomycetota bacterium]
MSGTVKRDHERGTWFLVVDLPNDPTTGKRQQLRRRGFRTRKEADAALAEVVADVNRGLYVRPTKGTLAEYLEGWLETRRLDLRPTTLYGYQKVVRQRIIPGIGRAKVAELDAATLERWYSSLIASGGRGGRGLSPKTVANTAGVLSVALGDAVRLKLLRYNPASDARLPRRERREMSAWNEADASAFLVAVRDHRLAPMWRLVLATGLRRGELCGLRWKDVDLAAGTLEVAETRVVAEEVVTGSPKTKAGSRIVALDVGTVSALTAWRKRQAVERLAAGPAWVDRGLVFVDELGEPPHPETVTRWWNEAVAAAGAPAIRFHDARHTAATMALRAGVPIKVVTQRLGHADVAVTMRVYQHVTAQDDRAAADALGQALGGS